MDATARHFPSELLSLVASSRRSFLKLSAAASTALALEIVTEPMLAAAHRKTYSPDAIMIDSNENPLGPSPAAQQAASAMLSQGGRYRDDLTEAFVAAYAQSEGLKPEYVSVFPGSSGPLHFAVLAYTSTTRSYVTADPGYEAGMFTAEGSGVRVVKVPLTGTYAHDVRAMIAAAPDAGVFYLCTPNNPTGTLTSHSDVEYLLENKPKGSIVLVDEAYIHFSDAPSVLDLVKADKELIVLRTFSKIYGMAGMRCGVAIGRPDLFSPVRKIAGWNFMPTTAVVAATASVRDTSLIPERRRINTAIREETFQWLNSRGYKYIPSQANFFLVDTRRPAKEAADAMAKQNVMIGRSWPILPNHARITVGTRPEMERFQAAFQSFMDGKVTSAAMLSKSTRRGFQGFSL